MDKIYMYYMNKSWKHNVEWKKQVELYIQVVSFMYINNTLCCYGCIIYSKGIKLWFHLDFVGRVVTCQNVKIGTGLEGIQMGLPVYL